MKRERIFPGLPRADFYPPADLTPTDRRMISEIIEQLIEVLDLAAGDCDLEDDDPAGDYLDTSEGEEEYETLPIYGVDQSRGPINECEAANARQRSMMSEQPPRGRGKI